MNSLRALWLLSAPWLAACESVGVNVGTEELCIADPRLVEAQSPQHPVSSCAQLGENQLINPGFELPAVASCGAAAEFCQFAAEQLEGWQTTSAEQVVEVWLDGYLDVPAPEGQQFCELDARSRDTVFQDLELEPQQLMYWSLLHRGRTGIDSMELRIGAPDAPAIQGVLSTPEDEWRRYSGLYRVGDEPVTRIALVSRNGVMEGNLVDSVVFAPVK